MNLAKKTSDAQVPLQVRNAPTQLMKELGYSKGYEWQSGFTPKDGFLPDELKDETIF